MKARTLLPVMYCWLGLLALGCTRYDTRGAEFTSQVTVPDEGFALVYVYRPKRQWGSIFEHTIQIGDRVIGLYAGRYGVFVVPEGTVTIDGVQVHASTKAPAFVRVEFDELVESFNPAAGVRWKAEVVEREEGLDDLRDTRLAAGGRARYPDLPVAGAPNAARKPDDNAVLGSPQ